MADLSPGFRNQPLERAPTPLPSEGRLPSWLQGVLLRTGPALFDLGPDRLTHWFDGLAKLHRLQFGPGGVTFSSRLLTSDALQGYRRRGRLDSQEFATRPRLKGLPRALNWLAGPRLTDNGNVNVLALPDASWLALTETTRPLRVRDDLSTSGHLRCRDGIRGQLTTAHPLRDPNSGEVVNLVIRLGLRSCYQVTSWDPGTQRRRLLAHLPVREPAYQHSFALTARFVVLLESPLRVHPMTLRFSERAYIDAYRWRTDEPATAWILDRDSGTVVQRHDLDPCFHFHIVNAWDEDECVLVDLPLYDDARIIDGLRLAALRRGDPLPPSRLNRLTLPLNGRTARREQLAGETVDLPGLHPRRVGQRHGVAFLAASRGGQFLDAILRWQEGIGVTHHWAVEGGFPGEALFVPRPAQAGGSERADDGVVLTMVLEPGRDRSWLAILDGRDLQELSRVYLPDVVPFSFHGQFRSDI